MRRPNREDFKTHAEYMKESQRYVDWINNKPNEDDFDYEREVVKLKNKIG